MEKKKKQQQSAPQNTLMVITEYRQLPHDPVIGKDGFIKWKQQKG